MTCSLTRVMVPEGGLEPPSPLQAADFESAAYAIPPLRRVVQAARRIAQHAPSTDPSPRHAIGRRIQTASHLILRSEPEEGFASRCARSRSSARRRHAQPRPAGRTLDWMEDRPSTTHVRETTVGARHGGLSLHLGRLEPPFVLLWIVASIPAVCFAVYWVIRRGPVTKRTTLRVLAAAPPIAALGLSLLIFGSGAHPLAQYNSPETVQLMRGWIPCWPLLMLGTVASVACGSVLSMLPRQRRGDRIGGVIFAATSCLAFQGVAQNFPSV